MATRAKATPVVEPQWPNCAVCARPISPEDGWLSIDDYAIYEREEAVAEWEETHGKSLESGFKIYTGEDILQHPDPVPWVWSHTGCDVGSDGYAVQAGVRGWGLRYVLLTLW
jgi:hypothetical protein